MGISLHDRAVSDSQKIHNNNLSVGGFSVLATVTSNDTVPLVKEIWLLYNDTSITVDPETGYAVIGSKVVVSFQQSDLTIWDGLSDIQRWKVSFVNGAGQTIVAEINGVMPDRSFGSVLAYCKIISGHRATT